MKVLDSRPRRDTPRAFSPVVALATGLVLSILVQFNDVTILVVSGALLAAAGIVALVNMRRRLTVSDPLVAVFWSLTVPAFVALCFSTVFVVGGLSR